MAINLPEHENPRVVIIGAGFGGLTLAKKLNKKDFQVVLIDKNNYHQFQPLFYQVAMSGLEPSSISFPLRKLFQKKGVFLRTAEVLSVLPNEKKIITPYGHVNYDYLVIANGATTNFYGNDKIEEHAITLKSTSESLFLRNRILTDFESALFERDHDLRQELIDVVIVGGGPTGVELAGSLAEMRKYIIPKDYPELNSDEVDIYLIQAGDRILNSMSEKASSKALKYLENLGVRVILNQYVTDYDGKVVKTNEGLQIPTTKMIWAAGIKANHLQGIPSDCIGIGNRICVNSYNEVIGLKDVYAIGDSCLMVTESYPDGHPQVAQTAIQQALNLASNLKNKKIEKPLKPFKYKDKGTLATVGRNKAVADFSVWKFGGFFAWVIWLVVHLFALIGTRNRIVVFLNWVWNYFTYDQSLRIIIKPVVNEEMKK